MKALYYHGVRDIRLENVPDPILSAPDSAIVKITACSICGSDLHPYHVNHGHAGYCIGHEAIGEVVETGRDVSRFRVGDRVVLTATLSCGQCPTCLAGDTVLCEIMSPRVFGQGIPGIGGCQAEAIEVPVADFNMVTLPSTMSDEVGLALTDAIPTGWVSAKKGRVYPGSKVLVIGLGAIGLAAVLSAFAQGAEQVFAMDLLEERRAAAAAFGAVPVEGESAEDTIKAATRGLGADIVIDANGSEQTFLLAMQLVRKGGHISIAGVSETLALAFPVGLALMKSINISYAICSVQPQLPPIFEAMEAGTLREDAMESLFTHQMTLAQGPEAYELFDARADGVKKILLRS